MKKNTSWFLPVDHRNLRAFYARGLMVPRLVMPKYREDLLAASPGVLPLFSTNPGTAVIEMSSGGGDGFPVVIEITDKAVPIGASQPWGNGIVMAAGTVIPTTSIVAVHVRRDAEAAEIRSREYKNIDPADIPLEVSPEIFTGEFGDAEQLVTWLSTEEGLHESSVDVLRDREAVAGSLLLLFDGLPAHEVILRKSAALLTSLTDMKGPCVPGLSAALDKLLWLNETDDAAIALCATSVIAEQSGPEPPTASEVLVAIRDSLMSLDLTDRAAAEKYLDGIERIARGEDEFRPFRAHGGLRSLKALLLFLLRPEANRTKVWMQEATNSEDEVTALALIYSGLSLSAAGIPTGQRGTHLLQEAITAWCALPFNDRMKASANLDCDVIIHESTVLLVKPDGSELRLWKQEVETLRDRLIRSALASSDEAVGFARKLAWHDCLEWVVECESFHVERAGQRIVVRLHAAREPAVKVLSQRFNDRLASLGEDEIRAQMPELDMNSSTTVAKSKPASRKPSAKILPEEPVGQELPLGLQPDEPQAS